MRRDHWIEIFRLTGVQTGQSRLHNVRDQNTEYRDRNDPAVRIQTCVFPSSVFSYLNSVFCLLAGGADRDRTDDLKLAKLALSQLSYGPGARRARKSENRNRKSDFRLLISDFRARPAGAWWARDELNVRPHAYQACALTT
jgi:hypothetical protein